MTDVLEDVRPRASSAALPVPVGKARKPGRKRIVIVGGGFAGVAAARALRRCQADVLLVDRRNHHLPALLAHRVATAVRRPDRRAVEQLAARQGFDVLMGGAAGEEPAVANG
jgi:NADH dehydrogenase